MRKYIGYAFLLISILTFIVWLVSQFIQPILPTTANDNLILIFGAFTSTIAAIAGFKEIVEFIKLLLSERKNVQSNEIHHNLPQPNYMRFIGRQEELKKIRELLSPSNRIFVITIDGVGGVGKSALALESAYTYIRKHRSLPRKERFKAIIWVTAKKKELMEGIIQHYQPLRNLEDLYSTIASILRRGDILNSIIETRAQLIGDALAHQRTLLIVDNLETIDDERLISFINGIPAPTKVIVTTRHRLNIAYPIRLLGMQEKDAIEFTEDECKKKGVNLNNEEITRLLQRTGGIPLAIEWSIGQISVGYTIESVLRRLGQQASDITKFCFEGALDLIRSKPAYKLLIALAYLNNNVSREDLGLTADLSIVDRDEGLMQLERLSLINKDGNIFQALPLTLAYIKEELEKNPDLLLDLTTPYIKIYRDYIKDVLGTTRLLGIPNLIDLRQLYVPIMIFRIPRNYQRVMQLKEIGNPAITEKLDATTIVGHMDRLFVLGRPGSGKTIFLKFIALEFVNKQINKLPIYISLKEFAQSGVTLFSFCAQKLRITQFPSPDRYFEQILRSGNVVLLLDGLDEVSKEEINRSNLFRQIDQIAMQFRSCQIIITSRTAATEYMLEHFDYVEISDFNDNQITNFAQNWFKDDPELASSFLSSLHANNSLIELGRNPLLLSMLCTVFSSTLSFPSRRVDLYNEASETLLKKWDATRGITRDEVSVSLSPQRKRYLINRIAAEAFLKGIRYIPKREIESTIVSYLSSLPDASKVDIDGEVILKGMESQHGLLIETSPYFYSFITYSFHEYFAAGYFVDQGHFALVANHINEDRWREVILLVASLIDDGTEFLSLLIAAIDKSLQEDKILRKFVSGLANSVPHFFEMPIEPSWLLLKETLERHLISSTVTNDEREKAVKFMNMGNLLVACMQAGFIREGEFIEKNFRGLFQNIE